MTSHIYYILYFANYLAVTGDFLDWFNDMPSVFGSIKLFLINFNITGSENPMYSNVFK